MQGRESETRTKNREIFLKSFCLARENPTVSGRTHLDNHPLSTVLFPSLEGAATEDHGTGTRDVCLELVDSYRDAESDQTQNVFTTSFVVQ